MNVYIYIYEYHCQNINSGLRSACEFRKQEPPAWAAGLVPMVPRRATWTHGQYSCSSQKQLLMVINRDINGDLMVINPLVMEY